MFCHRSQVRPLVFLGRNGDILRAGHAGLVDHSHQQAGFGVPVGRHHHGLVGIGGKQVLHVRLYGADIHPAAIHQNLARTGDLDEDHLGFLLDLIRIVRRPVHIDAELAHEGGRDDEEDQHDEDDVQHRGDVDLGFFFLCYGILIAVLILFAFIRDSRFGAALQAARQNEVRAASVGIAPYRIRLVAFVISGMITGLAGALFADLNRFVSPSMLSWHTSGEFIVLIILGGVARLYGPVAGAMLFVMFEFLLGGWTDRWQFFLGLILLGVVLLARGGLIGFLAGRPRHG
jgi:hypothetical protein